MGLFRTFTSLLFWVAAVTALYPYGPQIDQALPPGDETFTEIALQVPIKFYGQAYNHLYVNTDGILSFVTEIPKFFNAPFPLEYPVIAPFYSNVDTRGSGKIHYRETREGDVLSIVARKVAALYPSLPAFLPLSAVVVTWENVGYHDSKSDKVNTYQVVISSDGSESFVELLYPENGISWIRAESKGNFMLDARAQAGMSAPGGKLATLRGSGTDRVYNLPRWTNTLTTGEYMFRVGNIEETGQPEPPQESADIGEDDQEEPQSCEEGALLCHKFSECIDEPEGGFCCKCEKGYFGDGRNCLDYDSHRMLGKLNISINGIEARDLNMQAFIVTSDGRTYTAVSGVPREIGHDMQLLISLGSFVGFLFAKPHGSAPNGYQLTGGVVNHTVELSFDTRHHIRITQRYIGLDLFEQVKMEAEVVGTLPSVPPGTNLNVQDFQEQFTRIAPGLFRSQSKHIFEVDNAREKHEVTVDQTIQFQEFCPSAYRGLTSLRLKASRHYLSFEEKDSILRLASTNKISQNAEGQDPCVAGQVTCVANSSCLVEDDSFRCVCNPGFQTLPEQSSDFGCVDINECEDGSANCHSRALCVNEIGSYSCQCQPGYSGNGRHCEALEAPTLENGVCSGYGADQFCECNEGFEKIPDGSAAGFSCSDVDECVLSEPCDPNSYCYNTPGGFQCECAPGFQRIGLVCTETSGCGENSDCPEGSICRETITGPYCLCPDGYSGRPPYCQPDQVPEPNDECRSDSDCRENHICSFNTTYNIYACSCKPHFVQDGDSCIPPASDKTFVRTCINGKCWCPPGYIDDGELCVLETTTPIIPPQTLSCRDTKDCHANAQCIHVQTKGDYECKCNAGYEGDGYTCTEFEISCDQSQICDSNAECRYDPSSERHICICNDGFQGDGTTCYPTEEQCSRCHRDAICISGSCVCMEGFVGDGIAACEKSIPGCEELENCHPNADCLYDSNELGYRCKCKQGFEGDGYSCNQIITCHENPSMCSRAATCINTYTSYECRCMEGFFGNGTHCKEINRQEEEFLLLNKGRSIIRLPFNPSGTNIGQPIQINEQQAIGIAIDCVEGRVYWSDIMNQKIKSSRYNGSDVQDFIVSGVKSPEGLTIDWVNRVLYWTDSGLHVISSASLDDKEIKHIIDTGLVNPRGIAVNPHTRKLYWSDWNRKDPIIESSDLDGSNRQVLIQKPDVSLPNSLAIDWDSNEICWADAGLKRIECYDYYERGSRTVVQNCLYPFGLTITRDAYYWSDWSTGKVERSTKGSGQLKSVPLPIGGDDKLYGLVAVTSSCPN